MIDLTTAQVMELDEVDSTNTLARTLANEGQTDLPLVIVARRQTAGRGRGFHRWFSDSGSLTFTVLLDPENCGLRPAHGYLLALAAAVSVVDAIEPFLSREPAGIRWPNDVEIGGRKIAGLLPEHFETAFGPRLALGIGLNVSTRLDEAPPEVLLMATSLQRETGDDRSLPGLDVLRGLLLRHLSERLVQLSGDASNLIARWQALDTLRGQPLTIDQGPSVVVSGLGAGIREDGALLLQSERGVLPILGGSVRREGTTHTRRGR